MSILLTAGNEHLELKNSKNLCHVFFSMYIFIEFTNSYMKEYHAHNKNCLMVSFKGKVGAGKSQEVKQIILRHLTEVR